MIYTHERKNKSSGKHVGVGAGICEQSEGPHPLPSQIVHFALVSSFLVILSTCLTIEKYEKIEGCEQFNGRE